MQRQTRHATSGYVGSGVVDTSSFVLLHIMQVRSTAIETAYSRRRENEWSSAVEAPREVRCRQAPHGAGLDSTPWSGIPSAGIGSLPSRPPDNSPAQLVRSVLAYDRKHGLDFPTAWTDALDSLAGLETDERIGWTTALHATRHAWADSYYGVGERHSLDRSLLD